MCVCMQKNRTPGLPRELPMRPPRSGPRPVFIAAEQSSGCTMYVRIERCSCVKCGACWNTCPEIFDQNPCDEFSELVEAYRFCGNRAEGEVPEECAACAREAA